MKAIIPILAVVVALLVIAVRIQNNSLATLREAITDLRFNRAVMWTANKGGTNEITGWVVNHDEAFRQIEIHQVKGTNRVFTQMTPRAVASWEAGLRPTNEWKTYYMTHK